MANVSGELPSSGQAPKLTLNDTSNLSALIVVTFLKDILEEHYYEGLVKGITDQKRFRELTERENIRNMVQKVTGKLKAIMAKFPESNVTSVRQRCSRLDIHQANASAKYHVTAQHLFHDGITWGRLALFYSFTASFCVYVAESQMEDLVDSTIEWCLALQHSRLDPWILQSHGWDGFVEYADKALGEKPQVNEDDETHFHFSGKLVAAAAVIGAAALASFFGSR